LVWPSSNPSRCSRWSSSSPRSSNCLWNWRRNRSGFQAVQNRRALPPYCAAQGFVVSTKLFAVAIVDPDKCVQITLVFLDFHLTGFPQAFLLFLLFQVSSELSQAGLLLRWHVVRVRVVRAGIQKHERLVLGLLRCSNVRVTCETSRLRPDRISRGIPWVPVIPNSLGGTCPSVEWISSLRRRYLYCFFRF
jgi:hypothetical protein